MRRPVAPPFGVGLVTLVVVLALGAPFFAPHNPDRQFPQLLNAPPTSIHLLDETAHWRAPFIRPFLRVSQLEQRYEPAATLVSLRWLHEGRLVQSSQDDVAPLLLLGADSAGRDVFSRLLFGARTSLALATLAAALAIAIGALLGGLAGYRGGVVDDCLMRASDVVLILPAMYAALVLRSMLPQVLSASQVFALLTAIFTVMAIPVVARGVRGIVRTERHRDYALAALSIGAGSGRLLIRHLLPATVSFLVVQMTLLVPAFVVAEATFSYVGLGFPDPETTWGTMLQEASHVRALADFPWLLSPVVAMFVVVLALHMIGQRAASSLEPPLSL